MKRLFHKKFHYPKLVLLILAIILAYIVFTNSKTLNFISQLDNLKYLGSFIAGIFFAFGFTAPFSTGFFIVSNPDNIFLAAFIAAIGAVLADLTIFAIIKVSFMKEFLRLEHTAPVKEFRILIKHEFSHKIRVYLLYIFAGILIATPLPDEIGIIMLSGLTHVRGKFIALTSFILHFLSILILLSI